MAETLITPPTNPSPTQTPAIECPRCRCTRCNVTNTLPRRADSTVRVRYRQCTNPRCHLRFKTVQAFNPGTGLPVGFEQQSG